MKKKTVHEQILGYAEDIKKETLHWKAIAKYGCNDPMWADGTNLNLTRNHIIFDKEEIRTLCQQSGEQFPPEYLFPVPPEVDNNFFAEPESDRAQKIKSIPDWKCGNPVTQKKKSVSFDDSQLSLL